MSEVVPIRPGLASGDNRVEAFCDWATENIRLFSGDDEPLSVALAIIGKKTSGAVAWGEDGQPLNLTLAYAGALFTNRATMPG